MTDNEKFQITKIQDLIILMETAISENRMWVDDGHEYDAVKALYEMGNRDNDLTTYDTSNMSPFSREEFDKVYQDMILAGIITFDTKYETFH